MPHIHTEPGQHDQTAGAYIVRLGTGEPRLLLHLHKKLHTVLHFGGHVELNETPWQAVIHEVREESGYELRQLTLLQPKGSLRGLKGVDQHPLPVAHLTHELKPGHYHTDIQYVFTTTEQPAHEPIEGESTTMLEFTRSDLAGRSDPRMPENIRQTGLYIFDVCLPTWEPISL